MIGFDKVSKNELDLDINCQSLKAKKKKRKSLNTKMRKYIGFNPH